jgi:hypothetical protein
MIVWMKPGSRHQRPPIDIIWPSQVLQTSFFYLGWLRGGELFDTNHIEDLVVTPLEEAATRGLPPGIGLIELSLLLETKLDASKMADVIVAFCTLSGLNFGKWACRLAEHDSFVPGWLFSSANYPTWTSHIF